MRGKIIRGVGGFYYVYASQLSQVVECKAKGIFRSQNIKPLVGDDVELELIDMEKSLGNIVRILPRKNTIIRPAAANVDQAAVVFALSYPRPNLNLLDRFLLMMGTQQIPTIICFNKSDDQQEEVSRELLGHYSKSGADVFRTSTVTGAGLEPFQKALSGKTTILAGPSGVGKSSVMNALFPQAQMATGDISRKIKRGKHTTRHTELFYTGEGTFIMDTPGFTSLQLPQMEKEELREFYPEFTSYQDSCRFLGCVHIHEPGCSVRDALERGEISASRYENYKRFYEEIREYDIANPARKRR